MKCEKHNIEMLGPGEYPGEANYWCYRCNEDAKEIGQKYLGKIDSFLRERDSIKQYQILPEWFPKAMDEMLVEKNAEKVIKWPDMVTLDLLDEMDRQIEILHCHLEPNDSAEIEFDRSNVIRRCIHIALYAMMIADNAKRK